MSPPFGACRPYSCLHRQPLLIFPSMILLCTMQDLKSTVRAKAHQQRSLGQYRMVLGPDLAITVAMYATMQPATKGQVLVEG